MCGTFLPHGHSLGWEIGANALTLLYFPGLRRNNVNAPWPPEISIQLVIGYPLNDQ
jgi:hypothetical protein